MAKGKLNIAVDMEADRLQWKLRAIAKHTEALANELDEIDKPEDKEVEKSFLTIDKYMVVLAKAGDHSDILFTITTNVIQKLGSSIRVLHGRSVESSYYKEITISVSTA